MKTLPVTQGTPEWHTARAKCFTASEAPAMMGVSKYATRDELLRQKATGITPEVTPEMQRLFDKGHATEAAARPIIEALIGDDLYPVTAVHDDHDWLLASFDGIDMMETVIFEHKLWSEGLADRLRANEIAPHYYWQLEQQLLVSGAKKAIFVVSDGTRENMVTAEYFPVEGRAEQLMAGWEQFRKDLANYTPPEEAVEVEAEAIESLPTLTVQITGGVTKSNLADYEKFALNFIRNINTDLRTDEDFANAEAVVKFCSSTEKELEAVKVAALNQTADIADLFKTIDNIKAEMRSKRLATDKLVKSRKQLVKELMINDAKTEFDAHITKLEIRLSNVVSMPHIATNFEGVIKKKRTIESLRNAINTEMARIKIEANAVADCIDTNIKAMLEHAPNHRFLFTDLQQTCTKAADDFEAMVKLRVAEHEEQEARKLEAERERIREEEEAKARIKIEREQAEARQKAHDEERARIRAEREAQAEQQAKVEAELRQQAKPEPQKQPQPEPEVAEQVEPATEPQSFNFQRVQDQLKIVLRDLPNFKPSGLKATLIRIAEGI